jgi:2-methylisocitrate lyase-like PEP mutase family enzyme
MTQETQREKAESFRQLHLNKKLLILPNIWDVMGARMMELTGYPAVATASVAVAISQGYVDGEKIPFRQLLDLVNKISSSTILPLSVDMERGYADSIPRLKENIQELLENGAIGINLEDSLPDHKGFQSPDEQCRKIEAVRETALQQGIPLVINARTDFFFLKHPDAMNESILRAHAYQKAGADCIYPIMMSNYDDIARFLAAVELPVNLNLLKPISDLEKLEEMGISRVSVGPQLLNHVMTTMKGLAEELLQYNSNGFFSRPLLSREFMDSLA